MSQSLNDNIRSLIPPLLQCLKYTHQNRLRLRAPRAPIAITVLSHYHCTANRSLRLSSNKCSMLLPSPVVKQLLRQPGVGVITAITMRALIGQFGRFRTGKQLAHFCAVCPRNNATAGKTTTGGLIKAGDELLRQVLVEAAHRLIRYNPEWQAMATRLKVNGKKMCVIVAAVANRWIRRLFYQMVSSSHQAIAA